MLALQAPDNAPEDLTGDEDPPNERDQSFELASSKGLFQSTAAGLSVLANGSGKESCRCKRDCIMQPVRCTRPYETSFYLDALWQFRWKDVCDVVF